MTANPIDRLDCINLYARGDELVARCRLCGGELRRNTLTTPWNLWDLWDALGDHVRANHPLEPATHLLAD